VPLVQIRQVSYDTQLAAACAPATWVPEDTFTWVIDAMSCMLRPFEHRVEGRFVTGVAEAVASVDLGIERIEVQWAGAEPVPATLTINGTAYADGIWVRGEDRPPATFLITDTGDRDDRPLMMTMWLRGGGRTTMQLATFKAHWAHIESSVAPASPDLEGPWLHKIIRDWEVEPHVDYEVFKVASIGGYPIPHDSISGSLFPDQFLARNAQTTFEPGFALSTEVDAVMLPRAEALERMAAIGLVPRLPTPPSLGWQAVVTPLEASPSVRALWEAFAGVPPPTYEIELTARMREEP
jgi:hypothetical protein